MSPTLWAIGAALNAGFAAHNYYNRDKGERQPVLFACSVAATVLCGLWAITK